MFVIKFWYELVNAWAWADTLLLCDVPNTRPTLSLSRAHYFPCFTLRSFLCVLSACTFTLHFVYETRFFKTKFINWTIFSWNDLCWFYEIKCTKSHKKINKPNRPAPVPDLEQTYHTEMKYPQSIIEYDANICESETDNTHSPLTKIACKICYFSSASFLLGCNIHINV